MSNDKQIVSYDLEAISFSMVAEINRRDFEKVKGAIFRGRKRERPSKTSSAGK